MTGNSHRQRGEGRLDLTGVQGELHGKGLILTDPSREPWGPTGSTIAHGQQQWGNRASSARYRQGQSGSSVRKIKFGYGCSKAGNKGERVNRSSLYAHGTERDWYKCGKKMLRNKKGDNKAGKLCNHLLAIGDNWCAWSLQPEPDKK